MKKQKITIEKRTAIALEIEKGQQIKIDQSNGPQLVLLAAFNRNDLTEKNSQGNTKISLAFGPYKREKAKGKIPCWLEEGDIILSNRWNPMLTIKEDTFNRHDFTFDPCDTYLLVKIFGQDEGSLGCRELHTEALKPWNINYDNIPNGINLFQNSFYSNDGITVLPTETKSNDKIVFQSHLDLIVSISACPFPLGENKNVNVEIF